MNKETFAINPLSINGVEIPLQGVVSISTENTVSGMVKVVLLCDKECKISAVSNQ